MDLNICRALLCWVASTSRVQSTILGTTVEKLTPSSHAIPLSICCTTIKNDYFKGYQFISQLWMSTCFCLFSGWGVVDEYLRKPMDSFPRKTHMFPPPPAPATHTHSWGFQALSAWWGIPSLKNSTIGGECTLRGCSRDSLKWQCSHSLTTCGVCPRCTRLQTMVFWG